MTGLRQGWLVARRELRERSRSKGFRIGSVLMLLIVLAAIVVPAMIDSDPVTKHVGFAGDVPAALPDEVVAQGKTVDVKVRVHRYDDVAAGEDAVRDKDVDVLVVDARRLNWRGNPDERVRAFVTGAIQLTAVRDRATAAGIDPDELLALVAPVPVENVKLGIAAGRTPDDELAAYLMSVLLLGALATYGQLVLTGVVQEKSSRVVEVLLARMPARNLLAGKVAGIGLLGFAQFALTALAALVATLIVEGVDIPAISPDVLVWVVVWFVLGYVVYATAYGTFGSLASRTEDASSVAAPATTVLLVGYWASLMAVGGDPESAWSRFVSLFPPTAPFAMPSRIALGVTTWWEPYAAVAATLAAIAGLVVLAGRIYAGAALHGGATLKLRDAWRGTAAATATSGAPRADTGRTWWRTSRPGHKTTSAPARTIDRTTNILVIGTAAGLGVAAFVVAHDAIIGLMVGLAFYAIASRIIKARTHAAH